MFRPFRRASCRDTSDQSWRSKICSSAVVASTVSKKFSVSILALRVMREKKEVIMNTHVGDSGSDRSAEVRLGAVAKL